AVVDLDTPHSAPAYDAAATLVYSARADDVTHTIVGGQVVFDGEVADVDEERVLAQLREQALALRKKTL
ncbi:amidohydrolase, partial [Streptomyces sp. SID10244]|nr:amidohydrolase [Streptomyces sp. SID10244]